MYLFQSFNNVWSSQLISSPNNDSAWASLRCAKHLYNFQCWSNSIFWSIFFLPLQIFTHTSIYQELLLKPREIHRCRPVRASLFWQECHELALHPFQVPFWSPFPARSVALLSTFCPVIFAWSPALLSAWSTALLSILSPVCCVPHTEAACAICGMCAEGCPTLV